MIWGPALGPSDRKREPIPASCRPISVGTGRGVGGNRVLGWIPGNPTPETSIRAPIWIFCAAHKPTYSVWANPHLLNPCILPHLCHPPTQALPNEATQKKWGGGWMHHRLLGFLWSQGRQPPPWPQVLFCCFTSVLGAILDLMPYRLFEESQKSVVPGSPSHVSFTHWLLHPPQISMRTLTSINKQMSKQANK